MSMFASEASFLRLLLRSSRLCVKLLFSPHKDAKYAKKNAKISLRCKNNAEIGILVGNGIENT